MPAVEIQNLAAVARIQPDAVSMRHLNRILREHLRQVALERARRRAGVHVHPGAAAVRPVLSSNPSKRFIHCMPPPAAPLFKLSSTAITAIDVPLVTALKFA